MRILLISLFFISLFLNENVKAFSIEKHLDPKQEEIARELFLEVRCPICDGQVIESSDTQIAYELKSLIRKKISQGQTAEEIKSYLINQYGSDILISPPFESSSLLLWLLPIFFFFTGLGFILLHKKIKNKS